jgi:hypothetical protein
MSTELITTEGSAFLSMIERVAKDPTVDVSKLEKMLDMQERILTKNAEMSFAQAMSRLQPKLPIIKHTAQIKHGDKIISSYARYEDIDRQIKPLYAEEGFSIAFTSKKHETGTTYYGTLSHKEGHSVTAEMDLTADKSGAKNDIQAIASTISYAKRYLVGMLLNIVTSGEDDDGKRGGTQTISLEMAAEIDVEIKKVKADKDKFLAFMNVKDVREIPLKDYGKAVNALKDKAKEKK